MSSKRDWYELQKEDFKLVENTKKYRRSYLYINEYLLNKDFQKLVNKAANQYFLKFKETHFKHDKKVYILPRKDKMP